MNLDLMAFFSKNNLPIIKVGAYVINLDDKNSEGAHWVSLFIGRNRAVYFDSSGIKYTRILLQVLNKIRDKAITHNIFRSDYSQYIYQTLNLLCVDFIVSLS